MSEVLIGRITDVYNREQENPRQAHDREDVPFHYESITPEWLTDILCRDTPGAAVTGYRLGPRDDGTSGRRLIMIDYNEAGRTAGLPASVFGKSSQSLIQRIGYALNGSLHAETNFYNVVRPMLEINAPFSYHARSCKESYNSIVLLEDISGHARFCDETSRIDRGNAEDMVETLAVMHGTFYDPERYAAIQDCFYTFAQRWAGYVADNGMEEYTNKGFLAAEDVIPPRLFARFAEVWPRTMDGVAVAAKLPHSFSHGDTHLANWFRSVDGRMGLSDWQGCCLDHWARDYAYAVACALQPEDRRAWERDLLRLYLDRLAAHGGPREDFDTAWQMMRRQTLSALAYWTVTYTPSPGMPEDMQPKGRTREFIRRLAAAVDDLEALDAFD